MALSVGIVGLPNVGKSTLFNALSDAGAESANYPFCTIEPNVGVVPVPDPRQDAIVEVVEPASVVPTAVEFLDIAGLVKGASQGEGLGNQFLSHIRQVDAVCHVVRCFEDDNVIHVANSVDPAADIEVINTELALADLESVEKQLQKATRNAKSGDKDAVAMKALLEKLQAHLDQAKPVRSLALNDAERKLCTQLHLLTTKPTMYIANVSEDGFDDNPYLDAVRRIAEEEQAVVVPICNKLESEIAELDDDEKGEFLADLGMDEPGLDRVIHAGYQLLGLHTYFTAGVKEVRAWTIPVGATAPQAAGIIHTDFEKGFIRAEVIAYDDYIQYQGEQGAKDAGKWRLEGKDYIVKDGDVVHFRFNV